MKRFNKKKLILVFVFLIIILLSISIVIANTTFKNIKKIDKEKIYYQIDYFDKEIFYIANLLNVNDVSDWDELQSRTQRLYNYWNSTILDFNILEIDKKSLTDFGNTIDNLAVSTKNKDPISCFKNLLKIYNFLIIYSESLNLEYIYINILHAKYNLLTAYSIVETDNWTLVHENIVNSSTYLLNILNDIDNNEYNQYNINQAYIAVKEMENIINIKDIDIFYIKYNIAINKLENLQKFKL